MKFYVVFLLVNNYRGDVVVTTGLPGTSGVITVKSGGTVVVSEQPNNDNTFSVTAVDAATSELILINEQSSVSIKPDKEFGASFQVLFLDRVDPSKYIILQNVYEFFFRLLFLSCFNECCTFFVNFDPNANSFL